MRHFIENEVSRPSSRGAIPCLTFRVLLPTLRRQLVPLAGGSQPFSPALLATALAAGPLPSSHAAQIDTNRRHRMHKNSLYVVRIALPASGNNWTSRPYL
jgi:hypothetical protein